MTFRARIRRAFAVLALPGLLAPAAAQVAGASMGACPERAYLSRDLLTVAAAYSLTEDAGADVIRGWRGDQTLKDAIKVCAEKIRYAVCTDGMLMGLIDPVGAAAGGAAGLALTAKKGEASVLGGLLGSGIAGAAAGVVSMGRCRQAQAAIAPAAEAAFGGLDLAIGSLKTGDRLAGEVDAAVSQAALRGAVSAEDALYMKKYIAGVSAKLAP